MNILNYTRRPSSWLPGLSAANRDDLFANVVAQLCDEAFFEVNPRLTKENIVQALIAREATRTTAVGEGIAFPHARLENLAQALFAVVTLPEPVMFDEFPVQLVCLILVPTSEPTVSLKLMAQMSRMLMDAKTHEAVLAANSPEALRIIFKERNPRIDKPICARDIMRPPRFSIRTDTPVVTCSHMMSVNNLRAVPVVDEQNTILGEITTDILFRYGLPEFFAKLKSVSFIAEFDPFEKYFEDERNTSVTELMSPDFKTVPLEYTIMEIVFDLAIRKFGKLYVIDSGSRWVGTIDQGTVLDNVINH